MNKSKLEKTPVTILVLFLLGIGQFGISQNESDYQIGAGFEIGYRPAYANNNWFPGTAVDLRVNASKRIGKWAPEIYVRRNISNRTDIVEYHAAKTWEFGVVGNYFLKERHILLGGIGANLVTYQGYDYSASQGWIERSKRDKKFRFAYQLGYQFNFIKRKKIEIGAMLAYHSIRKLQIGFDLNFNLGK